MGRRQDQGVHRIGAAAAALLLCALLAAGRDARADIDMSGLWRIETDVAPFGGGPLLYTGVFAQSGGALSLDGGTGNIDPLTGVFLVSLGTAPCVSVPPFGCSPPSPYQWLDGVADPTGTTFTGTSAVYARALPGRPWVRFDFPTAGLRADALTTCGDGVTDRFEFCDDGPANGTTTCSCSSTCETTDPDGDGFCGTDDNCPFHPNLDQADADGDGTGDACDTDRDGDGVDDLVDNCPNLANADQLDADADRRGDPCDNCPAVANPTQADLDRDGLGNACDPIEATFATSDLRLRVSASGAGRLLLRGEGDSYAVPPRSLRIVDAASRTVTVDLGFVLGLRCHATPALVRCRDGKVRWKAAAAGGFFSRTFELQIRGLPGADALLPLAAPLTVMLGQQIEIPNGEQIDLVSTLDSCTAQQRGFRCE